MKSGLDALLEFLTKIVKKPRYAKVIVILSLMVFGVMNSEIRDKFGMSYDTLRKYKTALENGQIDSLFEFNGKRTKSGLDDYDEIIRREFDKNPPKTLRDAQARIEKLTGLKRSLHRIDVWLKKRGLKVGQ